MPMQGSAQENFGGFLHRFAERGVAVNCGGNFMQRTFGLHHDGDFLNNIGRMGAHQMSAKDDIVFVGDQLNKTGIFIVGRSHAAGHHVKLCGADAQAFLSGLFFGQAHVTDFRVRINRGGNDGVIFPIIEWY